LKDIWARLDAPDAIWFDGSVDALADILAARPDQLPAGVPDRSPQSKSEWRAVAMAVLARPFLAAQIWANHVQPDLFTHPDLPGQLTPKTTGQQPAEPGTDPDPEPAEQMPSASGGQIQGTSQTQPGVGDAATERAQTLIKTIDPTKFQPRTVLHIHISQDALKAEIDAAPDRDGIARVEDLGPHLLSTVRGWLGTGCHIKLAPTIDCNQIQPVDRYEVSPSMWEALLARSPASVYPWSGSTYRRMDADHTIGYRPPPDGPPGQTRPGNLGPLNRREHRYKTFGGIHVKQPSPGTFIWRTRHQRVIITNPAGTHDLGTGEFADTIWKAAYGQHVAPAA
jgi:hypothetical protein